MNDHSSGSPLALYPPEIAGFTTSELLAATRRSFLLRCVERASGRSVLLKTSRSNPTSARSRVLLQNHFEVLRTLDPAAGGSPTVALLEIAGRLVVVEDDDAVVAVAQWQRSFPNGLVPVREFVELAYRIAEALAALHTAGIIHQNITPFSVLVAPQTGMVRLTGFGRATRMARTVQEIVHVDALDGLFEYMAPEQSGRMSRGIDRRSDLYSLGAVLYELLLGRPMFTSDDPLELVHSHLARTPIEPSRLRDDVPPVLSNLIMKLLAKDPVERYQTAQGLVADLARCREAVRHGHFELFFVLGQDEARRRLEIPDDLIGRDAELRELQTAFVEAGQGRARLVVVDGISGIGKSALVNELRGPVTSQRGLFVRGKFEQFRLDVPFAGLGSALRDLVVWLTRLPAPSFQAIRNRIMTALGADAGMLVDIEPALEGLFGETTPAPPVPALEKASRQSAAVRTFFRELCRPEQPLVLFLDDVQWSDTNTVRLLGELLSDPTIHSLLVILCVRGNELPPGHMLPPTLEAIRSSGAVVARMLLKPLDIAATSILVRQALQGSTLATEIAMLIQIHSGGNPLSIRQALQTLDASGVLSFDAEHHAWVLLDLVAAREHLKDHDDLALLQNRIGGLDQIPRFVLSRVAALGSQFSLRDATLATEMPEVELLAALREGVEEGFLEVVRAGDDEQDQFRFRHDNIQQAAYRMLGDTDRARLHRRVGLAMKQQTAPEEISERVLTIVGHLNLALELLEQPAERVEIAELNCLAALRALSASAYNTASRCASIGLNILGEQAWTLAPAVALGLHNALAEAASLTGDLRTVETMTHAVWYTCADPLDRIRSTSALILGYAIQGRLMDAIEICRTALAWFGVELPRDPAPAQVEAALMAFVQVFGDRDAMDLLDLPAADDPIQLAILDLYGTLIAVAYIVSQPLFAWMILTAAERCIRHGNTPHAAFFYGCVGIVFVAFTRDIPQADRFGELSLALARRTESRSLRGRAIFLVGSAVAHWSRPLEESIELLLESRRLLLDAGDLEFAGYATYNIAQGLLLQGTTLAELDDRLAPFLKDLTDLRLSTARRWTGIVAQLVRTLRQADETGLLQLSGELFDAHSDLDAIRAAGDDTALAIYHINSLFLSLLAGDGSAAHEHARAARVSLHGLAEFPLGAAFRYFEACTLLLYPSESTDAAEQAALEEDLGLLDIFAAGNPGTFGHRQALVQALRMAGERSLVETLRALEGAMEQALAVGACYDAGMAGEFGFLLARRNGQQEAVASLLARARAAYAQWGATAKTRAIDALAARPAPVDDTDSGTIETARRLDFLALLKASQLLGSKLSLEEIPGTLLSIVQESAGATRSALVYQDQTEWLVQTRSIGEWQNAPTPIPLSTGMLVPQTLINQVLNTRSDVLVVNPEHDVSLRDDPYIAAQRPRSMLCLPLRYGQRSLGALYLENALVSGAFTPERIDALRILCSQAAIALQNALLYTHLKRNEERFRGIVENNLDVIGILDVQGRYTFLSPSATTTLGYPPEQLVGEIVLDRVHPEDRPAVEHTLFEVMQLPGVSRRVQLRFAHSSGQWLTLDIISKNLLDNPGIRGVVINIRDISEQRKAEARLQQAQRLEAVGKLTGGVAHDFNNLLMVMNGNLELAVEMLPPAVPVRDLLEQALRAGERGATLTRSLLAFARQQALQPAVVNLAQLVADLFGLIRRTIRENIDIRILAADDLWTCMVDPGQLQNVILNLVVNAQDAMPQGGLLIIELANLHLGDERQAEEIGLTPGEYVCLEVSDTGTGISAEILTRVFEPFFTTKAPGQGSGLGLSMVYGFACQSRGQVQIRSQVGVGTAVRLYLPRAVHEPVRARAASTAVARMNRRLRLLVVEDDAAVREVLVTMLRTLDYEVLEAPSGERALEILAAAPELDLLVTDLILAGDMNGVELLDRIRERQADLPALVISGHTYGEFGASNERPRMRFLQKPVSKAELDEAIRRALQE